MIFAAPTNERAAPICPNCGRSMHLTRTIPGIGGLVELRVYSCRQCGVSLTEADEPAQQMARD